MEEFKEAIIIMLSDYKSKYSAEKDSSNDKTEHFVYVQNFLQEFEEKLQAFAEEYFTENNFTAAQKEEAQDYIEKTLENLAADV